MFLGAPETLSIDDLKSKGFLLEKWADRRNQQTSRHEYKSQQIFKNQVFSRILQKLDFSKFQFLKLKIKQTINCATLLQVISLKLERHQTRFKMTNLLLCVQLQVIKVAGQSRNDLHLHHKRYRRSAGTVAQGTIRNLPTSNAELPIHTYCLRYQSKKFAFNHSQTVFTSNKQSFGLTSISLPPIVNFQEGRVDNLEHSRVYILSFSSN